MLVRSSVALILALTCMISSWAQQRSLILHSVVTDTFPRITAQIYRFDPKTGANVPLSRSEVEITEDGVQRTALSVRCPDNALRDEVSSVLTIDVSASMARGGPNIVLARAAAKAWIEALTPGSECAITSFDDHHYVNIDFTEDKQRLLETLPTLAPRGGTNYNEGFIGEPFGGLRIAASGTKKRVMVFLTDGQGVVTPDRVLQEAERDSVTIYCVSLGMVMPQVLRDIAERTGGVFFENVTTVEEAILAYRRIYEIVSGVGPCVVEWESATTCDASRSVQIKVGDDVVFTKYNAPDSAVASVQLNPTTLSFGVVPTATSLGREITLTARNSDVVITGIRRDGNARFKLLDTIFPVRLKSGQNVTWRVEYTATDTTYATARFDVLTDKCPGTYIFAVAGSDVQAPEQPTLNVVYPNGGERIIAGSAVILRYDGIPPDVAVRLDVSTDGGSTWTQAGFNVKNYQMRWIAPYIKSEQCLLRVTQEQMEQRSRTTGALLQLTDEHVRTVRYSPNGRYILTSGWEEQPDSARVLGHTRLHDASTGALLREFKDAEYARFSPNGTSIVTWGNGVLSLLNTVTGAVMWERPLLTIGVPPKNIEISKTGTVILVAGGKGDTTYVVDASTGKERCRLPRADKNITWATISPDGNMIAVCDADSSVHLYNSRNGSIQRSLREDRVGVFYRATFSPRDPLLAVTTNKGTTSLWNVTNGMKLRDVAQRQYINDNTYIAFSPDGSRMTVETGKDQTKIFEAQSGKEMITIQRMPDEGGVYDAVYSPDGQFIALNTLSKTTIYEANNGVAIGTFPRYDGVPTFSPDGSTVAIISSSSSVDVYPVKGRIFQRDVSDALWTIIKPEPVLKDVRFGTRLVGSALDSVVVGAISNKGEAPFTIRSLRIDGALGLEFAALSTPQRTLAPGQEMEIEYSFQPQKEGERAAAIMLETDIGTMRARITGRALAPSLSLNVKNVDFGAIPVGRTKSMLPTRFLRNASRTPITITGMRIVGPNASSFGIQFPQPFVLAPGEWREIPMSFSPTVEGRLSTLAEVTYKESQEPLQFTMSGKGGEERYSLVDPTTFRSIMLPTAVLPPVGTITTGVYDLVGLSVGYVAHKNVMVIAGGALPIPNKWFGATGYNASLSFAYSLGVKTGFVLSDKLVVGGGYHIGQSTYDQDYSEPIESRIVFNAFYATAGYGDDDSRLNAYLGYGFKHHMTAYEGDFMANATIIGLAYDKRISEHWKICGEAFFMRTMSFVPITVTARYFQKNFALEAGLTVIGIPASGAAAASFPIVPMLTWVQRW